MHNVGRRWSNDGWTVTIQYEIGSDTYAIRMLEKQGYGYLLYGEDGQGHYLQNGEQFPEGIVTLRVPDAGLAVLAQALVDHDPIETQLLDHLKATLASEQARTDKLLDHVVKTATK